MPYLVAMNGRKGMKTRYILAVLTKVMQEQQKKNIEQDRFIKEQKEIIHKLKERIKNLEEESKDNSDH